MTLSPKISKLAYSYYQDDDLSRTMYRIYFNFINGKVKQEELIYQQEIYKFDLYQPNPFQTELTKTYFIIRLKELIFLYFCLKLVSYLLFRIKKSYTEYFFFLNSISYYIEAS